LVSPDHLAGLLVADVRLACVELAAFDTVSAGSFSLGTV
jgi:hypothetical protein